MDVVCQVTLAALVLIFSLGSLFGLVRNSHWFFRGWEYPRVQICTLVVGFFTLYLLSEWYYGWDWSVWDSLLALVAIVAVCWHLFRILRYTRLTRKQVLADDDSLGGEAVCVSILTSNVQMENKDFDAYMQMVRSKKPDVVLILETDESWVEGTKPLQEEYEHVVALPQENWYGMMMLTNLDLIDYDVRYLVQDDIPSIHAKIGLPGGHTIQVRCLHPRPPEPIRGNHATSRDAELVVVGREVEDADEPVIVAGDLNDVAWSHTTRLFLRLSGMLDPRRGRGFFTSWPVDHPFWRVPLDHIFHSSDFTLRTLERMPDIGSDHYPIYAELVLRTPAREVQNSTDTFDDDQDEAQGMIEEAEEVNNRLVQSEERNPPGRSMMACAARFARSLRFGSSRIFVDPAV